MVSIFNINHILNQIHLQLKCEDAALKYGRIGLASKAPSKYLCNTPIYWTNR